MRNANARGLIVVKINSGESISTLSAYKISLHALFEGPQVKNEKEHVSWKEVPLVNNAPQKRSTEPFSDLIQQVVTTETSTHVVVESAKVSLCWAKGFA